ncbi:unnamed protein product, partial [Rotaria sordida]
AAVAKNSDTSNSLKPNGEQYLNDAKLYTQEFGVLGRIGICLAIVGGVINSMLYNVDGGHRDVIFDRFQGLQTINITLRILHRPRAELLPKIFCKFGFKICCTKSQFDAIELITQHTLIFQCVSELLTEHAAQFGLLLDDISITHLSFRPEFTSAVELKQRFLVEK